MVFRCRGAGVERRRRLGEGAEGSVSELGLGSGRVFDAFIVVEDRLGRCEVPLPLALLTPAPPCRRFLVGKGKMCVGIVLSGDERMVSGLRSADAGNSSTVSPGCRRRVT